MLNWNIEDINFWKTTGKKVAFRNLYVSCITLLFAFIVWILWSSLSANLLLLRSDLTNSDIYTLTALPLLTAAFLRIPYSFVVPWFGGRNWNTISTLIFVIPLLIFFYSIHYNLPKSYLFIASTLTGLAGANFASSSSNISYFFPYRYKSIALGINSSIGNLGVGIGQVCLPYMLIYNSKLELNEIPLIKGFTGLSSLILTLLGLTVILSIASYLFMDNINIPKRKLKDQLSVLTDKDCWNICTLYTFTFGAFIGLSSIFPFFIAEYFDPKLSLKYAFIGATISSLMRPLGHVLSKKIGSISATISSFLLLILGSLGVIISLCFLEKQNLQFGFFMISYLILFLGTGLGKGTTTAIIPDLYIVKSLRKNESKSSSASEISSVVGFSSAIGTFGAFFIPLLFSYFKENFSNNYYPFLFLLACFIMCTLLTFLKYGRRISTNPLTLKSSNGEIFLLDSPQKISLFENSKGL